ncbi:pilus assembly protein TadG-related protein [Streptomyces sp. NPDC007929]|uniref:pilus assembly protein TadG-related protein n=1 Tax=unclassified Streptomyces TaxID=2593676 RepID=UPI0036E9E1E7
MHTRRYGDAGQAFPIYITMVAGLLFLALAYFAVGQAAVNRNGAQTAADAAALAAAQDTRDKLADEWLAKVLDPATWDDIFNGRDAALDGCGRANQLAVQNDAEVRSCGQGPQLLSYRVDVQSSESVGDSIVPGTENQHAEASAIAVIESRCSFEFPLGNAPADALPTLDCEGQKWVLKPDDLTDLPAPEDLFDVHLAD